MTLTGTDDAEQLNVGLVSASLMSTLGVPAVIGRCFTSNPKFPAEPEMELERTDWTTWAKASPF